MRESRSSGSVEGVVGNHDSYSDSGLGPFITSRPGPRGAKDGCQGRAQHARRVCLAASRPSGIKRASMGGPGAGRSQPWPRRPRIPPSPSTATSARGGRRFPGGSARSGLGGTLKPDPAARHRAFRAQSPHRASRIGGFGDRLSRWQSFGFRGLAFSASEGRSGGSWLPSGALRAGRQDQDRAEFRGLHQPFEISRLGEGELVVGLTNGRSWGGPAGGRPWRARDCGGRVPGGRQGLRGGALRRERL
jgi:hypothetical protein